MMKILKPSKPYIILENLPSKS